ncbi:MAG: hypothetical protein K2X56_04580 [Mycobacterium pseudokansasii]|uniref:hypothetical protein n=1 Tax=Mycobacterium pseudokansasii TaxID=2341080 RepID=UPI0010A96814|nr:hypothetical protein [Mycobacterium pseudokansasii]MBY0387387.1 hypothetical protein [Mycobacterium pseudokansasii]
MGTHTLTGSLKRSNILILAIWVLNVTTERRKSPHGTVNAVFSCLEDAGKYVLAFVGDMLRLERGLEPLYRRWRQCGIGSALERSHADQRVVDFIADHNDVSRDVIRKFTHKYSVQRHPNRCAHLSSSDEPMSRVLTMSYDELDSMLIYGLSGIK